MKLEKFLKKYKKHPYIQFFNLVDLMLWK